MDEILSYEASMMILYYPDFKPVDGNLYHWTGHFVDKGNNKVELSIELSEKFPIDAPRICLTNGILPDKTTNLLFSWSKKKHLHDALFEIKKLMKNITVKIQPLLINEEDIELFRELKKKEFIMDKLGNIDDKKKLGVNKIKKDGSDVNRVTSEVKSQRYSNDSRCMFCLGIIEDYHCTACEKRCGLCGRAINTIDRDWTSCYICGVEFHLLHLEQYLRVNFICPVCRKTLSPVRYDRSKYKDISQKLVVTIYQSLGIQPDTGSEDHIALILHQLLIMFQTMMVEQNEMYSQNIAILKKLSLIEDNETKRTREIIKIFSPLVQEIEYIRILAQETLATNEIYEGLQHVNMRFDVIEEYLDILVESHKKLGYNMNKLENSLNGLVEIGMEDVTNLIDDQGMNENILSYSDKPTREGLSTIMSKIKKGLSGSLGNPSAWVKLASLFLI